MWRSPRFLVILTVALSLSATVHGQSQESDPARNHAGRSLVPYPFEAANYWGNDYRTINNTTDPQDCARRCDADPRCRVASFHGPRAPRGWANRCVLRNAVGQRHTEQADVYSWVKPSESTPRQRKVGVYSFEAANYWGNGYRTINNATDPQDCARRCDADPRCRVASFHGPRAPRGWANRCVLRNTVGQRHTEQADVSSWVKP